jgi:glucose-6-phosphate 1-dehydrogenase
MSDPPASNAAIASTGGATEGAPEGAGVANTGLQADESLPPNPLAEGIQAVRRAPPGLLVVFGASGDLTSRKLLPALDSLSRRRLLQEGFAVVGVARTPLDDEGFRQLMISAVPDAGPAWEEVVKHSRYVAGDYDDYSTFTRLHEQLDDLDSELGLPGNRTYYLATVPAVFQEVADRLGAQGLNRPSQPGGAVRLVIEKPFGHDLQSARELDAGLHRNFAESQIYRIDHYLGKETVQNVLALRFANAIFEPLWNRSYLDHVQITVAESLGVEKRGGFYERAGALRDIVQNHVMQVLSLTLMEPPGTIDAQGIRDEKVKALRSVVIPTPEQILTDVVRAQYDSGWSEGIAVPAYRQEPDVDPRSQTETYVAMKLYVDNWRWAGVPIYIRTGKRLPKRITEVALQFQGVPHLAFTAAESRELRPNALVLRIQPDEGVAIRFGAKVPGQAFKVRDVLMDMSYGTAFLEEPPDAYERLLLDAMVGDPTLFIRSDEVDQAWQIVQPLLTTWAERPTPLAGYAAGTWGPRQADQLIERDGRQWRTP